MIQVKKMLSDVDNLTENEKKRFELLTNIQNMIAAEYKYEDKIFHTRKSEYPDARTLLSQPAVTFPRKNAVRVYTQPLCLLLCHHR